jgi:hypothetical protein
MKAFEAALALVALSGIFGLPAPAVQSSVTITLVRWPFT